MIKQGLEKRHLILGERQVEQDFQSPSLVWTGPEDSRKVRFPEFLIQSANEGGNVVSPTHRPPLPPRKYFW